MAILRTFMNFDCYDLYYLHIQFSIPISIQVALGSCHGVQRKAKSRKALKLNDINNSEHAAVHAVYNIQCHIIYWLCLLLYLNTWTQGCTISLCWWRIIIWHTPSLILFIFSYTPLCKLHGDSYGKCLHNSCLAFKFILYIYYQILCSSPPSLQLSRNKPGAPHDSQCTHQILQN